ncbi:MAG: class D beta-lactamase [Bacteroidota bacterium]
MRVSLAFLPAICVFVWCFFSCGGTPESEAPSLTYQAPTEALFDSLFQAHDAVGSFLLQDVKGDTTYVYNEARAQTPYLPASTFKVPNTLIALELGVADTNEVFPWDGRERFAEQWNQDLNLAQAFRYSAFWVYQIIAERIGEENYREWLQKIDYGNAEPGPDVTTFWVAGDIRISAYEQLNFLRRLENGSLAFGEANQKLFRDIFSFEKTDQYDWKAKTGWTTIPDPDTGWVIGWVERGEDRYLYVLNLDIENNAHGRARVEIARAVFQSMGIID